MSDIVVNWNPSDEVAQVVHDQVLNDEDLINSYFEAMQAYTNDRPKYCCRVQVATQVTLRK